MPLRDNKTRLRHMLDTAEELLGFTAGKSYDDLLEDRALQYLCIHCLEIIGEAANALEPDYCEMHPEIPWRPIISMRNRLIHGYYDVELSLVWDTVTLNIPTLLPPLRALIDAN